MPSKILFIRLSSLGDIILTTPVVAAARRRYPEARIDFCTKLEYAPLVKQFPGVDHVVSVGQEVMNEARSEIALAEYDAIIDLHKSLRSRKLTWGLKHVVRVRKRTIRRLLLVKTKRNKLRDQPDVIGRYFEAAAKLLDIADDGSAPSLPIERQRVRSIALCPGSKHWNKKWPADNYIELARKLNLLGYQVELFGSSEDRELCAEIARSTPSAIDHSGKVSLNDLPLALSTCALAVTNDSGLMHLASAVGVPIVSFFGPTVKDLGFAPRAANATVLEVEGLYCRPCTTKGLDHCPEKHFRCMLEITPERALVNVERLLSDVPRS